MAILDLTNIKVSAIIPTHNRFSSLMQAIDSVRKQSHRNIEIVVVNDASTDKEYYSYGRENIAWIDLKQSTAEMFGFPCPGYVRNVGISMTNGGYIAFLDDDDIWFPEKTTKQLAVMEATGVGMSCTEGLMGDSLYEENKTYPLYNGEHFQSYYKDFFNHHYGIPDGTLPERIDLSLVRKHNCLITSSVMVKRSLLDRTGIHKELPIGEEDWDLWQRCLEYSDCIYLREPLIYYDGRLTASKRLEPRLRRRFSRAKTKVSRAYRTLLHRCFGRQYTDPYLPR